MQRRRVVITGMGALSPIGNTIDEVWDSIINKKCGIDNITQFDTENYKVKLAGEVKNLDVEKYLNKKDIRNSAKFIHFARIAAMQAMQDSKIDLEKIDSTRFGVLLGSGVGGMDEIERSEDKLRDRGPSRVSPFFIPSVIINLASGAVAIDYNAKGHCSSVVTACASSNNAMGAAFHKIAYGYEDIIITGGTEATITPLAVAGFMNMRALYEGDDKNAASIPFSKDRSGFVIGEGAAVLIFEELNHAKKRGAKIYAEVAGYGDSCDAFHITAPLDDGSGAALAMQRALDDAKISPSDIDYINAHGTSTPLNDRIETAAVKLCFKEHSKVLSMSSTKSYTGHLLGASGAIEAVITVLSLQNSYMPPTINYSEKDEECDLDIIPNEGRKKDFKYAMSNSLGFGGHNACIVFKKWEE